MKKTLVIGIGVVVVVLVAIGAAGTYYTSKSATCGTCHEMRTPYVSWQHSTHDSVQCMECHSDPGLWGQIVAKVEGAQRLAVHFTGTFDLIRAEVDNEICLQCHPNFKENDRLVALADHPLLERFPVHQRHEPLDLKCTNCHARMVHGRLHTSQPAAAENCRECHEERGILNPHGVLSKLRGPATKGLRWQTRQAETR